MYSSAGNAAHCEEIGIGVERPQRSLRRCGRRVRLFLWFVGEGRQVNVEVVGEGGHEDVDLVVGERQGIRHWAFGIGGGRRRWMKDVSW